MMSETECIELLNYYYNEWRTYVESISKCNSLAEQNHCIRMASECLGAYEATRFILQHDKK